MPVRILRNEAVGIFYIGTDETEGGVDEGSGIADLMAMPWFADSPNDIVGIAEDGDVEVCALAPDKDFIIRRECTNVLDEGGEAVEGFDDWDLLA